MISLVLQHRFGKHDSSPLPLSTHGSRRPLEWEGSENIQSHESDQTPGIPKSGLRFRKTGNHPRGGGNPSSEVGARNALH